MFGLETDIFILLSLCLFAACAFEFVNGFHDTANAVATVIYTNSLKPNVAVVWSGICNFAGVLLGGIGVAMGIVNLLPVEMLIDQNVYHSIAMVLALLLSAIAWNLGTWYFGLPSSSSHTLIGSILGVGLAFTLMPENKTGASAVNWTKAAETGQALLFSPLFGFSMAVVLMYVLKKTVKNDALFKEPKKNTPPPTWIRAVLIATCTGVSFFHGQNDGQKGVGLIMLILIGITPSFFALNTATDPTVIRQNLLAIEPVVCRIDSTGLGSEDAGRLRTIKMEINDLQTLLARASTTEEISAEHRIEVRRDVLLITNNTKKLMSSEDVKISDADRNILKSNTDEKNGLRRLTDYAPTWVLLMVALSLGLGTMVGWKRIVITVGEKIGKQHLTYAQGASAELVAASTIGMASLLAVPVSTTHVLSSGIAGSMVASKGIKNLQGGTIRNIALAWLLTLPVSILLSFTLYIFFRWIL
ncbi:inorganic phosphate transporter [Tellurirhabdus rosea]|uniref:inorganic phosphate transporter n=1 Tax=Tellurirhabdus rosea TaxID=2674997 RepID=UPI0022557DE7|nr:inorganic phosphate transporter [Tellurirhabdus rosea]